MNVAWKSVREFEDIRYEHFEGIAKITINRPRVRNAFRPLTVNEMREAFQHARMDNQIGVIVITGEGEKAFCSGGDQRIRGDAYTQRRRSGLSGAGARDHWWARRRPRL